MRYFSNKYSKIVKRSGSSPPPAPHYLWILVIWSCVIWPNCDVSNWLWCRAIANPTQPRGQKNFTWGQIFIIIFNVWSEK